MEYKENKIDQWLRTERQEKKVFCNEKGKK